MVPRAIGNLILFGANIRFFRELYLGYPMEV
jgi:hypothetical protein